MWPRQTWFPAVQPLPSERAVWARGTPLRLLRPWEMPSSGLWCWGRGRRLGLLGLSIRVCPVGGTVIMYMYAPLPLLYHPSIHLSVSRRVRPGRLVLPQLTHTPRGQARLGRAQWGANDA